jgi:hypothetical protein
LGRVLEGHTRRHELLVGGVHVVDVQVQQRRGRPSLEEQARPAEVQEGQPRRVEPCDEAQPEDVAVEGDRLVEVVRLLRHLVEPVDVHGPPLRRSS